jgi:hypothetical protein
MGRLLWQEKISSTYDSRSISHIVYRSIISNRYPLKDGIFHFGLLDSNIVVNTFGDNLHPQPAP